MSVFFKARSGNFSTSIGILLIRFSIGFLFLFAGARKVLDLQSFIRSVQETGQMNDTLAFILAFILPFMEMIFGALYIIGLFTPITSLFISIMTISFLVVLGVRHEELPYSYNFVILACSIATMFMGAGLISFDALLDRKKKTEVKEITPLTASAGNLGITTQDPIKITEKEINEGDVSKDESLH